jgi:hypothetical protein
MSDCRVTAEYRPQPVDGLSGFFGREDRPILVRVINPPPYRLTPAEALELANELQLAANAAAPASPEDRAVADMIAEGSPVVSEQ